MSENSNSTNDNAENDVAGGQGTDSSDLSKNPEKRHSKTTLANDEFISLGDSIDRSEETESEQRERLAKKYRAVQRRRTGQTDERSSGGSSLLRLIRVGGYHRVLLLVGLLVFVLYGMNEASKPQNWDWMGFEDSVELRSGSDTADSNPSSIQRPSHDSQSNPSSFQASKPLQAESESEQADQLAEAWPQLNLASASRQEFWRRTFRRLDRKSRIEFYEFVQSTANESDVAEELLTTHRELFKVIERFRNSYHGNLLKLMIEAGDRPELGQPSAGEMSWSELLLSLQQAWQYEISPAIKKTLDQKTLEPQESAALSWLRDQLKAIAMQHIKDGTADVRDLELPAWSELTRQLQATTADELANDSLGEVDMTQLLGQTSFYRGKVVSIAGTLLRLKKIVLANPIAGNSHIYELWIAPKNRSVFPYCVYAMDVPAEFHDVGTSTVELNRRIRVDGLLFKRRFYAASDGSAAECPLILAKVPDIDPPPVAVESASFELSWPMISLLVVAATLIALATARFAFGPSIRRARLPGTVDEKVNQNLTGLTTDPDVTTVDERLEKLRE